MSAPLVEILIYPGRPRGDRAGQHHSDPHEVGEVANLAGGRAPGCMMGAAMAACAGARISGTMPPIFAPDLHPGGNR